MKTLIVEFDCLFERSIRYSVDEVEAVLNQYAYVYQKLSQAALYSELGGSDLKRIWAWSNDTDLMLKEFPDGPPAHLDIRLEVSKLRTFLESARGSDFYRSRLYSDAESAISDWDNAGFSIIFVGKEPADRMRAALKVAGILHDRPCRRLDFPHEDTIRAILAEFNLDPDDTVCVGHTPIFILTLARRLSTNPIHVKKDRSIVGMGETIECTEVDSLSDVLSVLRSAAPSS